MLKLETVRPLVQRCSWRGGTAGSVQPVAGGAIAVDVSLEAAPAVLSDAVVLPDGAEAVNALRADDRTREFINDQYRHRKPDATVAALITCDS